MKSQVAEAADATGATPEVRTKRRSAVILPEEIATAGVTLCAYHRAAKQTDRMPPEELATPILGLFGEVGSVAAVLKKKRRDDASYPAYGAALREEIGDVLWYFCAVATRASLDLSILAQRVTRTISDWDDVQHDEFGTFADLQSESFNAAPEHGKVLDAASLLAALAGDLVNDFRGGKLTHNRDGISAHLVSILRALVAVAEAVDVGLQAAAEENLEKVYSRWPLERRYPPRGDADELLNERLPVRFTIFIEEHAHNGKTYVLQKRNGVIIGDRLTDNKAENDDYRFHDVFHIANAVHLGWSPVLRALFRLKRKSKPWLDENEDGARAILIEEGVVTFVFGQALERKLFVDIEKLDYDLLKFVSELVRGFEPETCALWQWERAILDGFRLFRELKVHRRGYVKADLDAHTLAFEPGDDRDYG
jgi:NTP pyrophosphatase (non-canonical NTP hydrolase)